MDQHIYEFDTVLDATSVPKLGKHCFANGGYADVWHSCLLFKNSSKTQTVAVKVWRGDPRCRKQFTQRLRQELATWNRLKHPNIVQFLGLVSGYGHVPALILPYYKNGHIIEYLRNNQFADIVPLLCDLASALSYIHHLNPPVSHGDIKGSNVFVDDQGSACLSDFGQTVIVGQQDFTTTHVGGSCRWMAPEVMNPKDATSTDSCYPVTPASDVFSFGMTALEMYTGKLPFAHRRHDSAVIFDVIRGARPPRPCNLDKLSDGIWNIIQSCWHQDPDRRPSMDAVGFWLEVESQKTLATQI